MRARSRRVAAQMQAQSAVTSDVDGGAQVTGAAGAPWGRDVCRCATAAGAAVAGVSALAGSMAAHQAQQTVPDSVREFQSPGRAQAFGVALLLSKEPAVRQRQFAPVGTEVERRQLRLRPTNAPTVDSIDPMQRLPATPTGLSRLATGSPWHSAKPWQALASELIYADASIDAFEFCLAKLLETLLRDELEARVPHGTLNLEAAEQEINVLFARSRNWGRRMSMQPGFAYEAG